MTQQRPLQAINLSETPVGVSIIGVDITLQPNFVTMTRDDWENAFKQYANTLAELIAEERSIQLNVAAGIDLDLHFHVTVDNADRITATGTGILVKHGEDASHAELMFQAHIRINADDAGIQAILVSVLPLQ